MTETERQLRPAVLADKGCFTDRLTISGEMVVLLRNPGYVPSNCNFVSNCRLNFCSSWRPVGIHGFMGGGESHSALNAAIEAWQTTTVWKQNTQFPLSAKNNNMSLSICPIIKNVWVAPPPLT
jgi:hypothetical protein